MSEDPEKEYICTNALHRGRKLTGYTLEQCLAKKCEHIGVIRDKN